MHRFELKTGVFGTIMEVTSDGEITMPSSPLHLRVRDATEQGKFVALVENLQREINSGAVFSERASLYHAALIGIWLERAAGIQDRQSDATGRLVAAYMERISKDFATGRNVQAFADEMGVTTTHLTRCCKTSLRQSALQILNERIFQEARMFLAFTKTPIRDISHSLGFSSSAYFTRSFQHTTNTTPSAFRRQHQQDA